MRAEGDISKEVFREKTSELEERLARLENEIEELNKQEEERIADDGWELHFEDLKSTLESYVDFGDELDVPESIVEGFIEKIEQLNKMLDEITSNLTEDEIKEKINEVKEKVETLFKEMKSNFSI